MKLKLKKFPRARSNSLVVTMGAGKALKFSSIGDVSPELDQKLANQIMTKFPDCFSMMVPVEKKVEKSDKMAAAPKNKAV